MPAIEPCLAPRDKGPESTPSILRTAGGGVAARAFLVKVGLTDLLFFSPSKAAMTSRRSSSSAASRLMMGVCGGRARFGELLPAIMGVFGLGQEDKDSEQRTMRSRQRGPVQSMDNHKIMSFVSTSRTKTTFNAMAQHLLACRSELVVVSWWGSSSSRLALLCPFAARLSSLNFHYSG